MRGTTQPTIQVLYKNKWSPSPCLLTQLGRLYSCSLRLPRLCCCPPCLPSSSPLPSEGMLLHVIWALSMACSRAGKQQGVHSWANNRRAAPHGVPCGGRGSAVNHGTHVYSRELPRLWWAHVNCLGLPGWARILHPVQRWPGGLPATSERAYRWKWVCPFYLILCLFFFFFNFT